MSACTRQMRYPSDTKSVAYFSEDLHDSNLERATVGLIRDESFDGCSLVFLATQPISVDSTYLLKVGQLATTQATAVWTKQIDEKLVSVGFQYAD